MAQDTHFVSGAAKLSQRIRTIRSALAVDPLVDAAAQLLLRRTLIRYAREVDPDNQPWEPLASATLARRKRAGGKPDKQILVQTNKLRESIQVIRGSAAGTLYINTGVGRRIGVVAESQIKKARAHQRGTPNTPVRRFLGIGKNDVTSIDGLMRRAANKAGLY